MKRAMLVGFLASIILIGAAEAIAFVRPDPPVWTPWLFMIGTSASLVTITGVGAVNRGRLGAVGWVLGGVLLILLSGFAFALAMPATDPADPSLWFGLPSRAAVILYGIGLLPFLVVPLCYALTFDRNTLRDEDWARVREAAAHHRGERAEAETDL